MGQVTGIGWHPSRGIQRVDAVGWRGRTAISEAETRVTERQARFLRVTFLEGKINVNIGPGDHSVDRWEISEEQLRLFILDAMPRVLGG